MSGSLSNSYASSIFSAQIHDTNHSTEEVIINKEIFPYVQEGDYIQVYDPDKPLEKLIFRVNYQHKHVNTRVGVSILKSIAEIIQLEAFQRVVVEKVIDVSLVSVDFVELAFRKQFLQRGNLWRYKQCMIGKVVHSGMNANVDRISAQVQELLRTRNNSQVPVVSGVITNDTHFIFRSRSTRLIWLIQISIEMWELDQQGDLYFEKLLYKLVTPMVEKWKHLSVSHSLTVVFFARTMYMGELDPGKETL